MSALQGMLAGAGATLGVNFLYFVIGMLAGTGATRGTKLLKSSQYLVLRGLYR